MGRPRSPYALDRLNQTVDATRAYLADGGQLPVSKKTALGRSHRLLFIRLSRGNVPWDTFRALEALPGWRWPAWLVGAELRAYRVASWRQHFHRTYGDRIPGARDYPAGVTAADFELIGRMHRTGRLSARLVEMFERIPSWQWTPGQGGPVRYVLPDRERLATQLEAVAAHIAAAGHSFVRSTDESAVAGSIRQLRQVARRGDLPDDVRATLTALPGWTWQNAAAERLQHQADFVASLRAFAAEFGHCRVPADYHSTAGFPLGARLSQILKRQQARGVDAGLSAALKGLPGWSEVSLSRRAPVPAATLTPSDPASSLAVMRQAAMRYGHVAIPSSLTVEGVPFGAHVTALRAMRPHLNAATAAALESLPGWFWNGNEAQVWLGVRRTAAATAAFVAITGHGRIPASYETPDGYPLGTRVRAVAKRFADGTYDARHAVLFASIPGWSFEALATGSVRVGAVAMAKPVAAARVHAAPIAVAHEQQMAHTSTLGGA